MKSRMRNSHTAFFIFACYSYKSLAFKMPVVLRLIRLLRLIYERCKAQQLSPN